MLQRLSRPDGHVGAGMNTVEPLMGLVPCRFRVPPRTQGPSDPEVMSLPIVALWVGRSFG